MRGRALRPERSVAGLLFLVALAGLAGLSLAVPLQLSPWQALLMWVVSSWAGFALGLGLMSLGLRPNDPRQPAGHEFHDERLQGKQ